MGHCRIIHNLVHGLLHHSPRFHGMGPDSPLQDGGVRNNVKLSSRPDSSYRNHQGIQRIVYGFTIVCRLVIMALAATIASFP